MLPLAIAATGLSGTILANTSFIGGASLISRFETVDEKGNQVFEKHTTGGFNASAYKNHINAI